ncbi:hypothetical protein [Carnimonas nigrificans]|uniref:hypothetical protein n=1 Tax=Carnimonas nigrificans TaxID=64323 RepID=UPI0004728A7C|nr:hypothetical protein [Carnimonas nigrificans]
MSEIAKLSGNVKAFASSLLEKASSQELDQLSHAGEPDQKELEEWSISSEEWNQAVQAALADRMADRAP